MFKSTGVLVVLVVSLGAVTAHAAELQDPTQPLAGVKRSGGSISIVRSDLTLDSILISPTRRIAVINGRSLGEGDFLDEVEVMLIEENGVDVRKNGRRI